MKLGAASLVSGKLQFSRRLWLNASLKQPLKANALANACWMLHSATLLPDLLFFKLEKPNHSVRSGQKATLQRDRHTCLLYRKNRTSRPKGGARELRRDFPPRKIDARDAHHIVQFANLVRSICFI